MDSKYRQALTEVLQVLNHTEKGLIVRIPKDFAIFLLENQDKEYKPNIDFTQDDLTTLLSIEAQAILAYIYKEYMIDKHEKIALATDEELVQMGQEMLKKYGAEDLFSQPSKETQKAISESVPVKIEIKPWYKRIFQKFFNLLK